MSPQLASGWAGVDRSDRQDQRRQGKSDPLDAVSAARAAQSGRARGAPKGRDGAVEAIRALMVARRSAAGERTRTIDQARALLLTGPDDLRARFTRHTPAALVTGLASLRPRPGDVAGYAVRVALRELGRRAWFPAASSAAWTSSSSRWWLPALRVCSPCTGSARALRRCCSSRPGITPGGYAARRPGRSPGRRVQRPGLHRRARHRHVGVPHPRPRRRVGPADLAHPPVREQRPPGPYRQGATPACAARPASA